MSLRPSEVLRIAEALDGALRGAVVQKVAAPTPERLELELRQPKRTVRLRLSVEPELARLSVISRRSPSPAPPSPWLLRVRKALAGTRLVRISAPGAREIELAFERGGIVHTLRAELGSRPELLLLDVQRGAISAALDRPRSPREPTPWPEAMLPSRLQGEGLELGEAAEALFAGRERKLRIDALRRARVQPLKTRLQRLGRTLEKVRGEAERREDAEFHRRWGELLQRNPDAPARGAREVQLTEWTESGPREVTVPLDPALGLRAQAERHFQQYRRLLRGSVVARARLSALEAERAELERAVAEAAELSDEALLAESQVAAEVRPRRTPKPVHRPYRVFLASGGQAIYVGRTGADNDALTFGVARPQDLWMHVRSVPGAHVVIPLERGAEVPQEVLLDAAHLALHHSERAREPRGEVSWAPVKFVRRVKGGGAGQVTYSRERTFVVRMEPERLARLLRSRGD